MLYRHHLIITSGPAAVSIVARHSANRGGLCFFNGHKQIFYGIRGSRWWWCPGSVINMVSIGGEFFDQLLHGTRGIHSVVQTDEEMITVDC